MFVLPQWDVSLLFLVCWTALACHITLLSVTVYLHRCQAHRAVDLHPVLEHFFRFWLWMTTGMVTREWVAVHRKHHAHCESPEDPHSPSIVGIRKVLLEGAELYRESAADPQVLEKYGHGTPDDWLEHRLYSRYRSLGIALLAFFYCYLFGIAGLAVFAIHMLCIPVLAAGVINGLGHYWGYRNFETNDAATNLTPLAAVICGEELHNNHHAYPSSARFSQHRWELDLGWIYLRIFSFLRLARIRRVAPRPQYDANKLEMDIETVRDIINSRLHVMENYARKVIKPVYAQELKSSLQHRQVLKDAARDLFKVEALLDDAAKMRLAAALAVSESLDSVYALKTQLQAIWKKTGASPESLLSLFQDWCREAEASGIDCLEDFALRLNGYQLKPQIETAN